MPKLQTRYLGLELAHPVVASASPLSGTVDGVRRLEDGGAAAIVLPSLFEEQISAFETPLAGDRSGAVGGGPAAPAGALRPDAYLELVRRARDAVAVPVIASLNGTTPGSWAHYGRSLQEAGAAAVELNVFHVPSDLTTRGADVERRHAEVVHAAREAITIPLAVKIGPFFSAPADVARRLVVAGADGLVLFNRFYQPDIDLNTLTWARQTQLSSRQEILLPLHWIALLYGQLPVSIAATTGVQTAAEVAKYLLAGADVVMTTSALLRQGPAYTRVLVAGLEDYLDRTHFLSVSEMRGVLSGSGKAGTDAGRSDYIAMLAGYHGDWRGSAAVARATAAYELGRRPALRPGDVTMPDVRGRRPPP
jgi:dihydroorotate dehydrogenase (fumarate)